MANATQRARAEGELGIMQKLQEQHLQEQQRWQKKENLQYFMQTVNANAQGDVQPLHQAVMLHALGMALPGNLLSAATHGASAGASTSSISNPALMLAPPAEADTSSMNVKCGSPMHTTSLTPRLIDRLTCMQCTLVSDEQGSSSASTSKKMSKKEMRIMLLQQLDKLREESPSSDSE